MQLIRPQEHHSSSGLFLPWLHRNGLMNSDGNHPANTDANANANANANVNAVASGHGTERKDEYASSSKTESSDSMHKNDSSTSTATINASAMHTGTKDPNIEVDASNHTSQSKIGDATTHRHGYVLKLGPHDVLLGRGTGPNNNSGNIEFRKAVENCKDAYVGTPSRKAKSAIVWRAVQGVKAKGGRFLSRLSKGDMKMRGLSYKEAYEVAPDVVAVEKVKQALRYVCYKKEDTKIIPKARPRKRKLSPSDSAQETAPDEKSAAVSAAAPATTSDAAKPTRSDIAEPALSSRLSASSSSSSSSSSRSKRSQPRVLAHKPKQHRIASQPDNPRSSAATSAPSLTAPPASMLASSVGPLQIAGRGSGSLRSGTSSFPSLSRISSQQQQQNEAVAGARSSDVSRSEARMDTHGVLARMDRVHASEATPKESDGSVGTGQSSANTIGLGLRTAQAQDSVHRTMQQHLNPMSTSLIDTSALRSLLQQQSTASTVPNIAQLGLGRLRSAMGSRLDTARIPDAEQLPTAAQLQYLMAAHNRGSSHAMLVDAARQAALTRALMSLQNARHGQGAAEALFRLTGRSSSGESNDSRPAGIAGALMPASGIDSSRTDEAVRAALVGLPGNDAPSWTGNRHSTGIDAGYSTSDIQPSPTGDVSSAAGADTVASAAATAMADRTRHLQEQHLLLSMLQQQQSAHPAFSSQAIPLPTDNHVQQQQQLHLLLHHLDEDSRRRLLLSMLAGTAPDGSTGTGAGGNAGRM